MSDKYTILRKWFNNKRMPESGFIDCPLAFFHAIFLYYQASCCTIVRYYCLGRVNKLAIAIIVLVGFVVDLILGDPAKIPHPIILIGLLIAKLEKMFRKIFPANKPGEIAGGIFLNISVLAISFVVPFFLLKWLTMFDVRLGYALNAFWCWQIFAARSLRNESMNVYKCLKSGDITASRQAIARIVGRDTDNLGEEQIAKAAIETVAENASDGVIAPMLFMIIGGAPLGFLYKAVNTLDSMVGYKNDKYINFGKFSARVDDVFNFIPARLTAFAMIIGAPFVKLSGKNAAKIWRRDHRNHASPNSANPESACAGALGVQLAGDAYYFGKLYEKKTIGDRLRDVMPEDIKKTVSLMYAAAAISLAVMEAIRILLVVYL